MAVETGRRAYWALNLSMNLLMAWTHIFSVLFFISQGLVLLFRRQRHGMGIMYWFAANGCFALSALLWIKLHDNGTILSGVSWITKPSIFNLENHSIFGFFMLCAGRRCLDSLDSSQMYIVHLMPIMDTLLAVIFLAIMLPAGIFALQRIHFPNDSPMVMSPKEKTIFLIAWLMAPPFFLYILSCLWVPCFVSRYMLYSLVPFCILISVGITALPVRWTRKTIVTTIMVLLGFQTIPLLAVPQRPDWKAAAAVVRQSFKPSLPLLTANELDKVSLHYFMEPFRRIKAAESPPDAASAALVLLKRHTGVVVVLQEAARRKICAAFEEKLTGLPVSFSVTTIRGARPIHIYHLVRQPNKPVSGQIIQTSTEDLMARFENTRHSK